MRKFYITTTLPYVNAEPSSLRSSLKPLGFNISALGKRMFPHRPFLAPHHN